MNNFIYKEFLEEISTFESYFGKVIQHNNKMLIPYISLGVSEHPLNKLSKMKYIDYCYTVFMGINYLKINDNILINNLFDTYNLINSIYLGGNDLLGNQNIYDIEVQAENSFLQLSENYNISENYWTPINTPNFRKNMDENTVKNFINNKKLPKNLSIIFDI
ncbi:hypothetical protein ABXT08_07230 [Chryseobacterium sp. NRRL B-14859]|uniref:hypothetical protein n=1 Tax=Chryseobacterium sp. NRRL B-14859 TaxID=1562763 RepID=UPI003396FCCA